MNNAHDAQEILFEQAIKAAGQTEKPYLGNPQAVEMILREAVNDVFWGTEGTQEFRYTMNADKMADIFLGVDTDFAPVAGWNDDDPLAGIIPFLDKHATTRHETIPAEKIKLVFGRLCGFVINLVEAEKNGIPDTELKDLLDAEMQKVSHLLVGIDLVEQAIKNPPNQDPEWD